MRRITAVSVSTAARDAWSKARPQLAAQSFELFAFIRSRRHHGMQRAGGAQVARHREEKAI